MYYNFVDIEKKWQKKWLEEKAFAVREDESKKKYYVLVQQLFSYVNGFFKFLCNFCSCLW